MKSPVVYRKIIDVQASHESLNGVKYIIHIYAQFFTFLPVHRQVGSRRVRTVKTECPADGGILVCLRHKSLHYIFKCMQIIICITLFNLKAETNGLSDARNG